MSSSQRIGHSLAQLEEIRLIIGSLKSIALLESQQAKHTATDQQQGLEVMRNAANNMLSAYPAIAPVTSSAVKVVLIFGSERGFCGDFNSQLVNRLHQLEDSGQLNDCALCPIGFRLTNRLGEDKRIITSLTAPSVIAEIGTQLTALMDVVGRLSSRYELASIAALYHDGTSHQPCLTPLLEALQAHDDTHTSTFPPLLNLAPERFVTQLVSEYILTCLNHILTQSFYAENMARLAHLNGALDRIEKQTASLEKQRNLLRQEFITQELETILLSSTMVNAKGEDRPHYRNKKTGA